MHNVALSTLGFVITMATGVSSSPSSSSLTLTLLPSYRRGKVYYLPIDRGAVEVFLRRMGSYFQSISVGMKAS